MTSPWQYALTVGPLGYYLWLVAVWQGGRQPRVVRGLVDFAMLCFGLGGLLAFGPFGQIVSRMLFRRDELADRMVVVSLLGLWACFLARRALNRLVVYHVDAAALIPALEDVLRETGGHFTRTLSGFEDRASACGLRLDLSRRLHCATVEAYGSHADALIQRVRPRLEQRLRGVTSRPSSVGLAFYGGSILVMLAPLVAMFLAQPRARDVLRVLLERLKGG